MGWRGEDGGMGGGSVNHKVPFRVGKATKSSQKAPIPHQKAIRGT